VGRRGKKTKAGSRAAPSRSTRLEFLPDRQNTEPDVPLRELLWQNRPGLLGLGLSLLQLLGHASWVALILFLEATGRTKSLDASSPWSWLVVILLAGSLLLTFLALFVCLFYGLRRTPRTPAVVGFLLSFFVGVLAAATVFLQGIREMSR
jgi:hypothetical protein